MNYKVGILTFHWATNYGAVLQCYALQETIKNHCNCSVEVIDYYPAYLKTGLHSVLSARSFGSLKTTILQILREKKIKQFRDKNLSVSSLHFNYGNEINNVYDVIICGSDQVWNPAFIRYGEKKTTLTYFLDFASNKCKRISYACSFGTDSLSDDIVEIILPELRKFTAISVRENSGKHILELMNIDSKVVCDPTLLLFRSHYLSLINVQKNECEYCFLYFLHEKNYLHQFIIQLSLRFVIIVNLIYQLKIG